MITELIDLALEKKEPRIRSGKYSPSSLGKCYRSQFWNRKNEIQSDPIDERTLRVFKAGDLFHTFIQDLILANYPEAKKEVLVETDDFKGYADLVLNDEVIDLKSQHSKAFWYRKNMEWKDLEPKLHANILQVVFYAVYLSKPKARLAFVSKDDLCLQEYPFEVKNSWREKLETEIETLQDFWEANKLPPAVPRAYEGKECKYCSWRTLCAGIEKAKEVSNVGGKNN